MKHVRESDQPFRGGDRGVKYMFRGPRLDWGIVLIKPGERMGEHGHREVEETFYIVEGSGKMIVDGRQFPA
ncbi:MAG: cupin domain-containing protein, partial [Planctomycetota bacterium]|nr:cupin domain-containing protein [Planctomycetota bacterium]